VAVKSVLGEMNSFLPAGPASFGGRRMNFSWQAAFEGWWRLKLPRIGGKLQAPVP
jgi:hypothetical protein